MRSRCAHVGVLAALIVVAVGCGQTKDRVSLGVVRHVYDSSAISLPLTEYGLTQEEERTLLRVQDLLTGKCASRFGVTPTLHVATGHVEAEIPPFDRRYGVINQAEIARYAYHLAPDPSAGADESKSSPTAWNPSPREQAVVTGQTSSGEAAHLRDSAGHPLPPGGCAMQAFQQAFGREYQAELALLNGLANDSYVHTENDPRALAVQAKWAHCMNTHGYDFSRRPDAAQSVLNKSLSAQRKMALLDRKCAVQVNYVGMWMAVDRAYMTQLMSSHAEQLNRVLERHQELLAKARSTLAGG